MKKYCLLSASVAFACLASTALAENAATIPVPRSFPTNWMARHEALVAQAKQGGIDLLFLGDSITEGWRWDKGGLKVWNQHYAPRHAADFGVGWDRIQNLLWRVQHGEIDGLKPKAIVLLIGTNNAGNEDDGKPRNTKAEIVEGIGVVLKELRTRLPESKVLLIGIFPRGSKDDPVREQVREINLQLAKLGDGQTVKFMDLSEKFLAPDGTLSREIMPDLLHLSEKGYQIWADAMEETLAEMLK